MLLRLLALVPVLAILAGVDLVNQYAPTVLGLPLVLAWQVGCVVLTVVIMWLIYRLDPANHKQDTGEQP